MMIKLENNTKIKLISILSAFVLWLYVMAVVDPEETKMFENIPIMINNMSELKDKDLVIYPEIELTTDVYLTGKRSSLQKLKREGIHVYGQINNPMEGQREMYLKASVSGGVTADFKNNNLMAINLDKIVNEKRIIEIETEGKLKNNIDNINIEQNNVKVSGPRTLVDKVQKVAAVLKDENKVEDFSAKLKLTPVDENGAEVKGVDLQTKTVDINVTLLKTKTVPIKVKDSSDLERPLDSYILSQSTVNIKGKRDIIDNINSISTKAVDLSTIDNENSLDAYLELPTGVTSNVNYITIKLDVSKIVTSEFIYSSNEVKIRNAKEDTESVEIPDEIKVVVEYNNSIEGLSKEDITLYIDLNEDIGTEKAYTIKYESKYTFKKITIQPNKI